MTRSSGKKILIGVIGTSKVNNALAKISEELGKEIARQGAVLVCGGLGGVMEYAAKGAKNNRGLTVGILPGESSSSANAYIDVAIATGIGEARNVIIVKTSHALIAIGKGYGTLSEISFALKLNKPVIGMKSWRISSRILCIDNPRKAVGKAIEFARKAVHLKDENRCSIRYAR